MMYQCLLPKHGGNNLFEEVRASGSLQISSRRLHIICGSKQIYKAPQLSRHVNGPKHPDTVLTASSLAWLLATTLNPQLRDPPRALTLAKQAVQDMSKDEYNWGILGAAYYAVGDWRKAIAALEKSEELAPGKLAAQNGFFLAMAHWQLSTPSAADAPSSVSRPSSAALEQVRHRDAARQAYSKGVQWLEKNPRDDPELSRFQAEAAKLLGLPDLQAPVQNHGK
jgi:tetratricopeptide (TPR) repeat protein